MLLYTTILLIKNRNIRYEVSRQDGGKFLLFKPELPLATADGAPIFWVTKQEGAWVPVNVQDQSLITQVLSDIEQHNIE